MYETEKSIIASHPDVYPIEFLAWFCGNEAIWTEFVAEARRVRALGFKRYSARTILHYLRHWTAVQEKPTCGWRINDHHSPYLARLFDMRFPSMAGMWEYRITHKPANTRLRASVQPPQLSMI